MIRRKLSEYSTRLSGAFFRIRMENAFKAFSESSAFDNRIPPPSINYNQKPCRTLDEYINVFRRNACAKELPFLVERCGLTPESTILDYGCGLGRLAYAASNFLSGGRYIGYEPNQRALAFLNGAYATRPNFRFLGEELHGADDYVGLQLGTASPAGIQSTAMDLSGIAGIEADAQYSSSVFTHMWIPAIERVLASFRTAMAPGGVCVNSWLIVDSVAEYGMRCGIADRVLPHEVKGALTYSLDNPLVCTAYRLDTVRGIYERGGHEILEILWGEWSGRATHNAVHYQDLVLSRPHR